MVRISMEDFKPGRLVALSAHIDGLQAAMQALDADEGSATSLRRIARSLVGVASRDGATQLESLARGIVEADDEHLPGATRDLLDYIAALRRNLPGEEAHVLVVEDDLTLAALVRAQLERPGLRLYHAADAAEAERLLAQHPIDVLLLDLILPDRDGRDLLLQLREDPATAELPVIVLSAKGGAVAKAECLAVGASEFLEKPADPAALREAVNRHVDGRRSRELAHLDRGTSLPNRAGLSEAFASARGEATGEGPVSVAVLSVQGLDDLAESRGEEARDALLLTIGQEASTDFLDSDALGRWGLAELVAIFPATGASDARARLKAGVGGLAGHAEVREVLEAGVTLSFGAGVAEAEPGVSLREAVQAAQNSLYRARESGRGVVLGTDEEVRDAAPARVLLVEDDRVTATLIHHRLVREGFEVMDFLNGEDAFDWAQDSDFDLAILDVKVPGMDGFELLEKLRAMPRFANVPIVMLTGLGSEADVVRGLELGANDYILKPFSPTELLARARRLVHESAGTGPAQGPSASRAEAGAH